MASLRPQKDVKKQAERLHGLFIELGRLRSLRDPLSDLHDLGLTPPQMHALMWLGVEGALSAGVLAKRIGSSLPACTGVVDRLEKMGLCERGRAEGDRRVVLVELTTKGATLFREAHAAVIEQLGVLLGLMDAADRASLMGIFERLVEAMKVRRAALKESE
jgi:DNA-binding MarR family transcriptional regulator